jgi:hypothetical protein
MKTALWIILAVVVIGAIGTGAYLLGKSTAQPKTVTQTTTQSTSPESSAPKTCRSDDFTATLVNGEGAAGSVYYDVQLTKKTTGDCVTEGYPGISLVDANGTQIGSPAERDTSVTSTQKTLSENQKIAATIRVPQAGNFPDGQCKTGATQLKIYAPNATDSITVATTITSWCPGFTTSALH